MFLITNVTAAPLQNMTLTLPDSTTVSLTLYFAPQQFGWFLTNITYNAFILNGIRVVNSPNFLLQYQNQIPFGLACYSQGNREPSQQQDFSSSASQLFLLDQTDMAEVFAFIQSGTGAT
jgi:hypothetical protein